ncbi:hypothetical protein AB0F91_13980 [Amycolatopsis sp. NPDC023774]|uniref:hypothetical protein n=1 Tax=Amycolatopsis sp. NPDC023774 TaxID=3155015 RepID=UPI0033EC73FB
MQRDAVGTGRGVLRAVGSFFGGSLQDLRYSADQWRYDRATNDRALAAAVKEIGPSFRQRRGCGDWMCTDQCWNAEIGQCLRCPPSVAEEISRAQAPHSATRSATAPATGPATSTWTPAPT